MEYDGKVAFAVYEYYLLYLNRENPSFSVVGRSAELLVHSAFQNKSRAGALHILNHFKISQCCRSEMFIPDPNFSIPDPV
jgi:hypothetical protein